MFLCLENTASSKNFPAGTFIFSMRYQHLSLFFVTSVLSKILPVWSLSYQVLPYTLQEGDKEWRGQSSATNQTHIQRWREKCIEIISTCVFPV